MENNSLVTRSSSDPNQNSIVKTLGILILIVSFFAVGFSIGRVSGTGSNTSWVFDDTPATTNDNFDLFWQVWNAMDKYYVEGEKVDYESMYHGAIKGMVDSFGDPATVFLTPDETEEFNKSNEGKYFEGIGAELGYRDGVISIVAPIAGSPAEKAGVRAGDLIIKVDDYTVKSTDSIYDIVTKIRGESGSKVKLTLARTGETKPLEITITRGEITVTSIEVKKPSQLDPSLSMYDGKISVLSVTRFTEATLNEWQKKWDDAIKKVKASGSKGLIIDLRNNPGGYLDGAVYAAEDFLRVGTIVLKEQNRDEEIIEFKVTRTGRLLDFPVVILVNEGSASASEIFAGALQADNRAKIIGVKTYGKGTAQSIFPLDNGSSIHITIMKWLLPDGTWLNRDNPITPDIEIDRTEEEFKKGNDSQLKKAAESLGL